MFQRVTQTTSYTVIEAESRQLICNSYFILDLCYLQRNYKLWGVTIYNALNHIYGYDKDTSIYEHEMG